MRAIDVNTGSEDDIVDTLFIDFDNRLSQGDFTTPETYQSFLHYFNATLSFRLACKFSYNTEGFMCNERSQDLYVTYVCVYICAHVTFNVYKLC